MRVALVERATGKVVNVIVVEGAWAPPEGYDLVDASKDGGPGDTWDGMVFSHPPSDPSPSPVDEAVEDVVDAIDVLLANRVLAGLTVPERDVLTARLKRLRGV